MRYLIAAALMLSGCASFGFGNAFGKAANYQTKDGLKIHLKGKKMPSPGDVEEVIGYMTDILGSEHKLNQYRLMLINRWIVIQDYNEDDYDLADGYTNSIDHVMIVSVLQTCFADSGFPHELGHALHDEAIPDWHHSDTEYWEKIKVIEKQIIKDLCPSDYQRREVPTDKDYVWE